MAFQVGSRLGHYDVTALIGEGGMGQVYRATDTQLGRDVALKILPDAFASDPDRLARFQREAQVLASLNHPNIAQIHGIEKSEDTQALVLELVEGPTLADRIAKGPIPLDEALPIAKQIAEALEAAHEAGVIHRDLKPANIKVREDGTVKVLDFGLAKALGPAPEGDPSQSPTMTAAATRMGVVIGTAAYMSPEQARGKEVDKRSDVWAFGCVLYEMLAGQPTWGGETVTDVMAALVTKEPAFDRLPADTLPGLIRLLERCLHKVPRHRWHDIGDVRIAIEDAMARPAVAPDHQPPAGHPHPRPVGWVVVALLVGALVGGLGVQRYWPATTPAPVVRTTIDLAGSLERLEMLALSRDGRRLVYAANDKLWVRPLDQLESTAISGTEGGTSPFFAPDGESIGFFTATELKRVSLAGGAPTLLAAVQRGLGGSWGPDDRIVFGREGQFGLSVVPATGGEVTTFAELGDRYDLEWPAFLPDGEWVLFTDNVDSIDDWNNSNIAAQSVRTGERRLVLERGQMAQYSPTGHLVFARDGWVYGVAFDADRMEVTGEPVPLVEGLAVEGPGAATNFGLATNGTLVYRRAVPADRTLVWVDREGREEPIDLPARDYYWPRLSPDQTRFAVGIYDADRNVWVSDFARPALFPVTTDRSDDHPSIWMPDGESIVFQSTRDAGRQAFFTTRADGTGEPELLLPHQGEGYTFPFSWSPDGSTLAFQYLGATTESDIGRYSLDSGSWEPLLATDAREMHPAISPDGGWLAFTLEESTGPAQVYLARLPALDVRRLISTGGGRAPSGQGMGTSCSIAGSMTAP